MPTLLKAELAKQIVDRYDVPYAKILPAQSGYRNSSFKVVLQDQTARNLMIFKAEPDMLARLQRADAISGYLAGQGLPVRQRVDCRILKLQSGGRYPRYAALYDYLPGKTISWESYSKDHIKLLGLAMAKLHRELQAAPHQVLPLTTDNKISLILEKLLADMQNYFSNIGVLQALQRKLNLKLSVAFSLLSEAVSAGDTLPTQHYLHLDLVRGNVLFSNQPTGSLMLNDLAITGIIDFEKTAFGSPLFDLARTLAFLLVDCKYKSAEKVRKYFLYSGYQKRGGGAIPLVHSSASNKLLLDVYTELFLVHDFYKFLKHNPYEYLQQNEHFIRTRDILVQKGMLEYSL